MDDRVGSDPAVYLRLVEHLLSHTNPPFWDCHSLPGIVAKLKETLDDTAISGIREHALRLGCTDAADW